MCNIQLRSTAGNIWWFRVSCSVPSAYVICTCTPSLYINLLRKRNGIQHWNLIVKLLIRQFLLGRYMETNRYDIVFFK